MTKENMFESEDYASLRSKEAIKSAKETGGHAVFPGTHELQLDIDDEASLEVLEANLSILKWMIGVCETRKRPSRTEGKFHVTIVLDEPVMSDMERILLQACLGSDPKRELLSYARVLQRDEHPTLFIEGGIKPPKTIQVWYIKDKYGVSSIFHSLEEANTGFDTYNRYLHGKRGPGMVLSKWILKEAWDKEEVTLANIDDLPNLGGRKIDG